MDESRGGGTVRFTNRSNSSVHDVVNEENQMNDQDAIRITDLPPSYEEYMDQKMKSSVP